MDNRIASTSFQESSSPLLNNNQQPVFLESAHYKEWARNLKRAVRSREPWIKFLVNFLMYVGETGSLVFTLLTGVVLPSRDEHPYASAIAIVLYIVTCVFCVVVSEGNKNKILSQVDPYIQRRYTAKEIILNLFMVLKPVRYWKVFNVRREKLRVIQEETTGSSDNIRITENGLKALVDICAEDLEDQRVNLYECHFQSIPMALLQCGFLFVAHESFTLCTVQDLSRLSTIMFALANTAKADCSFETGSYEYQASLHFLGFFKSRGSHPMRVYSEGMISWGNASRFVCHFFTAVFRFYTTAFFMAAHWSLGLIYLTAMFVVNLMTLKLFPQHLLENYCNAPFGVHSCASYYADRFINMFSNVGTRFNKFSNRPLTFGSSRARVPLQLIQIIHFLVPVCVTALLGGAYREELLRSVSDKDVSSNNTITEVLSGCPELSEWYSLSPMISERLADLLFPFYKELDDHLATFNDVFLQLHFVWALFGFQVVFSIAYGYGDLFRRQADPKDQQDLEDGYLNEAYPILTAYDFWGPLLSKALNPDPFSTRIKRVRMLMALTVFREHQFYRVVRILNMFPRPLRFLGDKFLKKEISKYISNCTDSNEQLETLARQSCTGEVRREDRHHFHNEFCKIYFLICDPRNEQKVDDIRLFVMFLSVFDRKMYELTSDRVGRVVNYLM